MSDPDGGVKGDLQFDRADYGGAAPTALTCKQCGTPISTAYFEAGGLILCEACRYTLEDFLKSKAGLGGVLKAVGAGVAAGIVGWVIYYAVLALSGYEFGLIAVVVGFMVGKAVRWGSGNRGGALFQAMAILITYITIVTTYVPLVIKGIREQAAQEAKQAQQIQPGREPGQAATAVPAAQPAEAIAAQTATPPSSTVPSPAAAPASPAAAPVSASAASPAPAATAARATAAKEAPPALTGGQIAAALGMFGLLILALPFLQGFSNIIGIAIVGFALYEAWKINRRVKVEFTGPFTPGQATTPGGQPA